MWLVPIHSGRVAPGIHSMLDEFFRGYTASESSSFSPQLDIKEDEKAYHILVEVPGIDKEDVDVSLKDNVLTVKGEKKQETKEDKDGYCRAERTYGSFLRTIRLPENTKWDQVEARLDKGILQIILPKAEQVERKRIMVN